MSVVSDTSPLNYLILLQAIDLLPRIYGEIFVPDSVMLELTSLGAPERVRSWAASPPSWLRAAVVPQGNDEDLARLDTGERHALMLASSMGAQTILADDMRARMAARGRGIDTVTTLLILEQAAERGWIDLAGSIESLRQTNFRVREETLQDLLRRHQQKRQ